MSNRNRTRKTVMPYMQGPEYKQTVTNQVFAKFRSGIAYLVEMRKVRRKGVEQQRPIFHRITPKVRAKKSPNKRGYYINEVKL